MELIEKKDQFRRDFTGIYECESCGERETRIRCYDDDYFHDKVMPNEKCRICGKSTNDLGIVSKRCQTKYSPHEVV